MKSQIVTLTVNPSLDKSTTFHGLLAEQKIRCSEPHYDAGGGGINVSKAIARLGGESVCTFTSGGSSGKRLENLLEKEKIRTDAITVENPTRENLIALDSATNRQYRFGFPGEPMSENEMDAIRQAVSKRKPEFLVISGSLSSHMPPAFYADIVSESNQRGVKCIVDTSGAALKEVFKVGCFLAKPNIGELAKLSGHETLDASQAIGVARNLISNGAAEMIAVSLGPHGAILVTKLETFTVRAPHARKKSTVGAGDSMVGGMTWALSQSKSLQETIRWGVACGTAATMNEGTQLFNKEDAQQLYERISK